MEPVSKNHTDLQENASSRGTKIFANCSFEVAQQAKRIFTAFPKFDLLDLRDACSYIEKNKEELLKKTPALYRVEGRFITIFHSSNQKIYLFFRGSEYCIENGNHKSIYLGLDYFKEKPVAYFLFNEKKLLQKVARSHLSVEGKAIYEKEIALTKQVILQEIDFLNYLKNATPKKSLPGIAKIIDSDLINQKIIGIYKYYNLGNLTEVQRSLTYEEKLKVGYDLLIGLTNLNHHHSQHNDIKEDNIFRDVNLKKESNRVKTVIANFGCATRGKGKEIYDFGGSPYYYPPEKIRGMTHPDKTGNLSYEQGNCSDVWALGCVLFQLFSEIKCPWFAMLTPFTENFYEEKETAAKIVEKWMEDHFKEESDDDIYNLLKEMLQPDYKKRLTAEQGAERIKKLLPDYHSSRVPPLKIPENDGYYDSLDTPDTADTSTPKDTSQRGSATRTPKTNRARTHRSNSTLGKIEGLCK